MRTPLTLLTALAVAVLFACCKSTAPDLSGVEADPDQVPTQFSVYPTEPVLQLTFEATAAGYTLVDARQITGAPSLNVDLNRDVLITARDASGDEVGALSVFNPRTAHTAGSTEPASAVLDRATFTVTLANPQAIQTIDLTVRRGPNGELAQTFAVR